MRSWLPAVALLGGWVYRLSAGDWPQWRYDAARSAASPDEIAAKPVLIWSRSLPPVRQAWPLEPNQRINFDASYEPVVIGQTLLLASPNDGSVTAYDTETGAERWKFFTEGPVRCAPACWNGKVLAGSDDGYLYCLDAQTGRLLWKFRGAPEERPDRRHLGNGHLVSFWPVRGGPVVKDGVVYFAAGIWPIFGVFVHALDADTGRVKWSNGELHYIAEVRGHPSTRPCDRGVSPQGYLALLRDRLVVPCGRSLPAGLDAATGKLIYYAQGVRRGESRVALCGDYAFVGKDAMLTLADCREIEHRQPLVPYKFVTGCDASSAFAADGAAYGMVNGTLYAYDVAGSRIVERQRSDPWGTPRALLSWEPLIRWQYQTPYTGPLKTRPAIDGRPWGYDATPLSSLTIKAGSRLYTYLGKKLIAVENLEGPPRIAWEKDLDDTPSSLVAGDGKLFVATAEGNIYCYGSQPSRADTVPTSNQTAAAHVPVRWPLGTSSATTSDVPASPAFSSGGCSNQVQELLKVTGVNAGYCLVLGLTDGTLTDELLRQTALLVLAVDADAAKIDKLRRRYAATGLLGSRVELFVGNPFTFLFPPYIASLIVSEDAGRAGFSTALDATKLFELLRPYGGTLCLELPADLRPQFATWAGGAASTGAVVKQQGNWSLLVREGPLPGAAPWTHLACDAANTFCSADDRVRAPLGFLWYGDVPMVWPEYPSGYSLKLAVSGGRVYHHGPRSTNFLVNVYDAYTGRPLWHKVIPTQHRRAALVMMPESLYFAADSTCDVLDPNTGEVLTSFHLTNAGQVATGLRVDGDIILIASAVVGEAQRAPFPNPQGDISSTLICLDRQTGEELWRRDAQQRFHDSALAVGGGMVFAVDSIPFEMAEKAAGKPENLRELQSTVIALDARTGREAWRRTLVYDATRTFTAAERYGGPDTADDGHHYRPERKDWLSYSAETDLVLAGRCLFGSAFEARTGKVRWEQKDIRGSAPIVLRGKTVFTSGGKVYDMLTGALIGDYKGIRKLACNYAIASKHLAVIRRDDASYYDVAGDKVYTLRNIRSSCMNNMIPAEGLLNSPCFTPGDCICNYAIQTSFAMITMPEVAAWSGGTPLVMSPPPVKGQ